MKGPQTQLFDVMLIDPSEWQPKFFFFDISLVLDCIDSRYWVERMYQLKVTPQDDPSIILFHFSNLVR